MNQRPKVSDEEIKSFMDFQGVLTQHDTKLKAIKRTSLIRKIVIPTLVVVTAVVVYWKVESNQTPTPVPQRKETQNDITSTPQENEEQVEPIAKQPDTQPAIEKKSSEDDVKKDKATPTSPSEVVETNEPEEKTVEASYVQAEPTSGYPLLYEYFASKLIYPQEALKDSIQGVSTVSFIINKDGTPGKIEVVNSLGPAFDKEIARLIESMPGWKPALLNGKPVASKISLPITFQIQKVKAKE